MWDHGRRGRPRRRPVLTVQLWSTVQCTGPRGAQSQALLTAQPAEMSCRIRTCARDSPGALLATGLPAQLTRYAAQRLRDQGKIDEHGNLLVPWPDDMQPGSTTDL